MAAAPCCTFRFITISYCIKSVTADALFNTTAAGSTNGFTNQEQMFYSCRIHDHRQRGFLYVEGRQGGDRELRLRSYLVYFLKFVLLSNSFHKASKTGTLNGTGNKCASSFRLNKTSLRDSTKTKHYPEAQSNINPHEEERCVVKKGRTTVL